MRSRLTGVLVTAVAVAAIVLLYTFVLTRGRLP